MGLYLATIAPEQYWTDDPEATCAIRVIYKRQVKWAKPCLPLGAFTPPTKDWVLRNRKRFKVWVICEKQIVARMQQDSIVYIGFLPMGGDVHPEPNPATALSYPNVAVSETGDWRLEIESGDNMSLRLVRVETPAEPVAVVDKDGNIELAADFTAKGAGKVEGNLSVGTGVQKTLVLHDPLVALLNSWATALAALGVTLPPAQAAGLSSAKITTDG